MAHDAPDSLASLIVCEPHDPGDPGALQFDAKCQKFGPKGASITTSIRRTSGQYEAPARRRDIVRQEGCEQLFWGICDAPASDTIVLFICWTDASAQAAGQHLVTRLPDDIAVLLSKLPEIFHLPSVASRNLRHFSPSFEVVFLSCPTASVDRQHFEHYYWSFAWTLRAGAVCNERGRYDHLASAGDNCGGGWNSRPVNIDGQDADVFIGFIHWQDKAARNQWYKDYSNMSYEKLGGGLMG